MNERCLRVPGRQGLCLESWRPRWCLEVGAEDPVSVGVSQFGAGVRG